MKTPKPLKKFIMIISRTNMVQTQNKSVLEDVEVISLPEFLNQVFKFLEGDMVFKHQVKKEYQIPGQVPPLRFIYNHVAQLIIEWIRRCLPAMDQIDAPSIVINIVTEQNQVIAKLTVNVPFKDKGLRLPFSFYIDRLTLKDIIVEHLTTDTENSLIITFPRK